jgi:hypothetical protein
MKFVALLTVSALAALSTAQATKSPFSDTINLKTSIGSFKLIDGKGTASFSFEGTVLLINAEGPVKVEGAVKKEFDDPKMKRVSYFGKGKITVTGSWRGIQWFGSNLNGFVKGKCTIRLTGEFDRNLDTGFYWYGDRVDAKNPWYTSGITVPLPEDPRMNPKPIRRGGYGGG